MADRRSNPFYFIKTVRKPATWEEMPSFVPNAEQVEALEKMQIVCLEDSATPMDESFAPIAGRVIAEHRGAYYLVETEGYSYVREGARIASAWWQSGAGRVPLGHVVAVPKAPRKVTVMMLVSFEVPEDQMPLSVREHYERQLGSDLAAAGYENVQATFARKIRGAE